MDDVRVFSIVDAARMAPVTRLSPVGSATHATVHGDPVRTLAELGESLLESRKAVAKEA